MFAKIQNNQILKFPYTWQDLRDDNPETLFPSEFSEKIMIDYGCVKIALTTKPEENHLQSAVQKTPELINGVWTQIWETIAASENQIQERTEEKAIEIRCKRNELLIRSDFSQTSDYDAGVDKQAWATYRQALRDVPNQAGFPWTVDWPVI